ncbi:integrase core domain-containing protein [Catenulispora sp. EB89]|uniref:integrase core domain-containing protein n=1 Tax=Catenulispora sp. EB89 TaxID=3156257 RepID=UPI0035128758
MEVGTRAVHILGITEYPTSTWATQCTRSLIPDLGERAGEFHHPIRERDAKFTDALDAVFTSENIEVKKSAPQAPKMNAYAERFVLTARTECTDRMLIFSERHQRTVLHRYARHYNTAQPHRTLNLRAPADDANIIPFPAQRVRREPVLGGLINEYRRAS